MRELRVTIMPVESRTQIRCAWNRLRRKWHLSLRGDQDSDESDTDAGTLSSTRRPPGTSGNVMTWYSMSKPGNRNLVLRVFGARLGGILLPVS